MAQPEEILRKQVDVVASEMNLKDYTVEIKPLSTDGANYMSINFKINISSFNHPDVKLFAKVAVFSEAMRQQVPIDLIYQREIVAYTTMLATFEKLQEKYEILEEDRFKFAKYYGGSFESQKECIIMEDLGEQGYKLYDRFKPVTWEYAAKGVEEIAKFHALSLAFKHEYPDEYAGLFDKDAEMFEPMFETIKMSYTVMAETAYAVLSEQMKQRLEKFVQSQFIEDNYKKYYVDSKHGFIVHGDYRASNVLFKRQGGKVKGFVPVDYQGYRMGSPSVDLLYFIYCGTDAEFRKLHLKRLLDLYYRTLASFLRQLNLDPEQEFSRKDFDEDYKNVLAHGLVTATTILPIVMVESENAPKTTGTDSGDMSSFTVMKGSESFKTRFLPILNEFINYGIV